MPTVLRFDGLRVVVYPNDHRPAHVHVIGEDCEAVFNLQCPHGPPELRENYKFSQNRLGTIKRRLQVNLVVKRRLQVNLVVLCAAWEKIHGNQ